ncbi:hypothetical protein Poly59_07710 [Rubripirellula reticaptiva]|uniref:Uncharacterized protein n=1 Tax=Rubripirellula reticaptiva TaxID=2528013 RepID=A0A5C6FAS0_9BACT|nr:hypothetical protein Poly59_07710 [Rubripirellula reticaptiva]
MREHAKNISFRAIGGGIMDLTLLFQDKLHPVTRIGR